MATREPELYKDKVEVSLDGRQIFYLFFGGAVLVGLVFVLGVMVGRRVESRSHVDGLSRMDPSRGASDPLAALDGLESKKLTFHDALTKDPPRTAVEQQIDDLARTKADAKPEPKAAKPEPKPEPKPEKAIADKVDKADKADKADKKPDKADKADKADKKPEKKSDKANEPITKPDQLSKADKAPTDKSAARGATNDAQSTTKKKVEDRINGDVITASDPKPEPAAKKETAGKFTLQLSSFQDKHEAEAFLSSVKAAGYQAYVTEAEVGGKGTFYRVRMGKYTSLESANDAKADVEKAIKKSASVMRL